MGTLLSAAHYLYMRHYVSPHWGVVWNDVGDRLAYQLLNEHIRNHYNELRREGC